MATLSTRTARRLAQADKDRRALPRERKAPCGGILTTCLSIDWWTPPRLVAAVQRYAPIALDPATAKSNPTGAQQWIYPPRDGLKEDWAGTAGAVDGWSGLVFVNPPYGKALRPWLAKIVQEAKAGTHMIALLPCARFEQGYLHELLEQAQAVCWVRKRVAFIRAETGDAVGGNAYASMFLLFNGDAERFEEAMGKFDDGRGRIGLVQRFA